MGVGGGGVGQGWQVTLARHNTHVYGITYHEHRQSHQGFRIAARVSRGMYDYAFHEARMYVYIYVVYIYMDFVYTAVSWSD